MAKRPKVTEAPVDIDSIVEAATHVEADVEADVELTAEAEVELKTPSRIITRVGNILKVSNQTLSEMEAGRQAIARKR